MDGFELTGFTGLVRLGAGGLGDVYRATRVSTGGDVAIKLLRDWTDRDVAWQRAQRELRALVGLRGHPHVIQVEEVVESAGMIAIVMELAPGGSVSDLMRRRGAPLSFAECLLIGEHASSALAASHQRGIIHRDIKPHNLLIGAFGQVKVCDFGIAALTRSESVSERTSALSYRYASPEELRGDAAVTAAADVYSLAATLNHVVTGTYLPVATTGASVEALAGWSPTSDVPVDVAAQFRAVVAASADTTPTARPTASDLTEAFASMSQQLGAHRCRALELPPIDDDATAVRRIGTGIVPAVVVEPPAAAVTDAGPTIIRSAPVDGAARQPVVTMPPVLPTSPRSNRTGVIVAAVVLSLGLFAVAGAIVVGSRGSGDATVLGDDQLDDGVVTTTSPVMTDLVASTVASTSPSTTSTTAATTTSTTSTTVAPTTPAIVAATAPPTPPPTPAPTVAAVVFTLDSHDAADRFRSYISTAATERLYDAAWGMLSGPYQVKYKGYDNFVRFWETVSDAGIYNWSTVRDTDDSVTLRAEMWYGRRVDGTTSNELVEVDLIVDQQTGQILISDYRYLGEL